MPNQDLINYFKQNLSSYSLPELKQQALSQGYSPQEVEEATRGAQGSSAADSAVQGVSQWSPMSSKVSWKEGAIAGVIIAVVFSIVRIPISFVSLSAVTAGLGGSLFAGGLGIVASLISVPFAAVFGAIGGAIYGWIVITFQDKLPGSNLFMKTLIPILGLSILFMLPSLLALFFNPLYTLLSDLLSLASAFFFAKLFASRMGG